MAIEWRSAELVDVEMKGNNFRGYAAVFDAPWNDFLTGQFGYVEKVKPGAFRKALSKTENIPLLWQHDRQQLLATTRGNTLRLKEDGKGLLVEAKLPKTGLGAQVREMVERGDVRGMSYGREAAPSDTKFEKRDGLVYRLVTGAQRLLDVSLTWEPAYPGTEVELRSLDFVALPLQEITSGAESQTGEAVEATPPDEDKPDAWWEPDEGESAPGDARNWREKEIDVLEM